MTQIAGNKLISLLNIDYPIIMAPMFLVTNESMMRAASEAGIAGCIPALNYRTIEEFKKGLENLDKVCERDYGINLIVNQSNPLWERQLEALLMSRAKFVITSLGNPAEVIRKCHEKDKLVFCDVTDMHFAKKVSDLGADGLIAVNSGAGGHAGKIPGSVLVPSLVEQFSIPIISAGGVGDAGGVSSMMKLGASGLSIGSIFIACEESPVDQSYKQACVDYGAKDIIMTSKISGTPCTVINTPYVQKMGTEQNFVEKLLNKNRKFKKYVKMLTFYKGMKALEKAAFKATYKTVWCAGPSIEFTRKIESITEIVARLKEGFNEK